MSAVMSYVKSLNWVTLLLGILIGRFLVSRFV
jgi:hypothetical protein